MTYIRYQCHKDNYLYIVSLDNIGVLTHVYIHDQKRDIISNVIPLLHDSPSLFHFMDGYRNTSLILIYRDV